MGHRVRAQGLALAGTRTHAGLPLNCKGHRWRQRAWQAVSGTKGHSNRTGTLHASGCRHLDLQHCMPGLDWLTNRLQLLSCLTGVTLQTLPFLQRTEAHTEMQVPCRSPACRAERAPVRGQGSRSASQRCGAEAGVQEVREAEAAVPGLSGVAGGGGPPLPGVGSEPTERVRQHVLS